jgi:hypothetical protein
MFSPPVRESGAPWLRRGFSFLSGFPTEKRKRILLMPFDIQAVADDSGCKGQGSHLVMGGLIAPAEIWADFSVKWAECLQETPTIRYFKLYEATSCTGQFSGMGAPMRDAKLAALAAVISRYRMVAMLVSVDLADHEMDSATARPTKSRGSNQLKQLASIGTIAANPYYEAYMCFIMGACFDLWDMGLREQFDFIVDEHPSLGAKTAAWYPVVKKIVPEPMRSIMPVAPIQRDDKSFMPLQAADMIAGLERLAVEGKSGFAWLEECFSSVVRASRCVRINKAWYERNAAIVKATDFQPSAESLVELERLGGPLIHGAEALDFFKKKWLLP